MMYFIDPRNLGARIADLLVRTTGLSDDVAVHSVFGLAALAATAATFLRVWAASYLTKDVVHDARSHYETLVADGPYRYTRNPLYLAVDILAIATSVIASLPGAVIMVVGIVFFDYRLIFREEAGLEANQTGQFVKFKRAVPRLIPSITPRLPPSGTRANWKSGFTSELFFIAFALGMVAFAFSLDSRWLLYFCGGGMLVLFLTGVQSSRKKKIA